MPSDNTLSIIVKLQDEASAGLAALHEKVKAAAGGIASASTGAGEALSTLGTKLSTAGTQMQSTGMMMSVGLTLPIVAFGKAANTAAVDFQRAMEMVRTQAGGSQKEVEDMSRAILNLTESGATGQLPVQLAEAAMHAVSLGYHGKEAMDMIRVAADASDSSTADLTQTLNALGGAVVSGIKGAEDYRGAMGILDATVGAGNMTMQEMVASMSTGVLPIMAQAGVSLASYGAALATLTDNNMRADEAATRLRMSVALMTAPSSKAAKYLTDIGLSSTEAMARTSSMQAALKESGLTTTLFADDLRKPNGILVALRDLKSHLEAAGLSADAANAVMAKIFGGGRSDAAVMTLFTEMPRMQQRYEQITEKGTAKNFQENVDATHNTDAFKQKQAQSEIAGTLTDIGLRIAPVVAAALKNIAAAFQEISHVFLEMSPRMQSFAINTLMVVAALGPVLAIGGTVVRMLGLMSTTIGWLLGGATGETGLVALWGVLGSVGTALAAISAPVWITIAVIVALGLAAYEMWKHWSVVKGFLLEMWTTVKNATKIAVDFIVGVVAIMLDTMLPGWRANLRLLFTLWKEAWDKIKEYFGIIAQGIQDAVSVALNWITDKISMVTGAWQAMVQIISKPIQSGLGMVGNALSGAGSYFQNAAATAVKVGAGITHFETGGFVNAPRGTEVPAILHGGEEIVPAEYAGRSKGGSNVTIVIQNPTVRRNSDLDDMRNMVEQVMRPILLNAKIAHI